MAPIMLNMLNRNLEQVNFEGLFDKQTKRLKKSRKDAKNINIALIWRLNFKDE